MNSRERVMMSLNFKKPDRVARFDEFWPEFRAKLIQEKSLPEDADLQEYFNIDIHIAVPEESFFPTKRERIEETDTYIIERSGWGSIWKQQKNGYFFEFIEPFLKKEADLDNLAFDPAGLDSRYAEWQEEVAREKACGRCVFGKIGGPYMRSGFLRGEMNFLMDIAGDPEFARELAGRVGGHLLAVGIEELRRGSLCDTGIWIFDDLGSNRGPIMSPQSFESIFYPVYKELVHGLKQAGAAKVGLHSDGNIMPLLDMLLDTGIDILNPIEPKAGMSIREIRRKYGTKIACVGGMCNSVVLPFGSREEIIASTREILDIAREGGVIIGAHSIGPDIPTANYQAYADTVLEEGDWGRKRGLIKCLKK